MSLRAWVWVAGCSVLSGCFVHPGDPPAETQITCDPAAPACPSGWECDPEVRRCFLGGVANLPGIRASPAAIVTAEDGPTTNDTLSVSLLIAPAATVSVQISSSDPSEGRPAVDVLTFTPANWSQAQVVRVIGLDDDAIDGDQPYSLVLGPTISTDVRYAGLTPIEVPATNQDRDQAALVVVASPNLLTTENGGSATFTIRLSAAPAADVVVPIDSSRPGEASASVTELTFTPGNWSQPVPVVLSGQDDLPPVRDGDTPFVMTLGPSTSTDPAFAGLTGEVSGTNADNDVAGFIVDAAGGVVVSEAGSSDSFTVRLRTRPAASVSVPLDSVPAGRVSLSPATVTLDASNWDNGVTVTVTGLNDSPPVDDGDEVVTLSLGAATSSDPAYSGLKPADVQATALDDDAPGFVFDPAGGFVVSERGTSAAMKLRLATQPAADVTVSLSTSSAGEASVSPASLTFTPADWDVVQTVTITGVDDSPPVADGIQSFLVELAPAVSGDPSYAGLQPGPLPGVNVDDDVPSIVVTSEPALSVLERASLVAAHVALATRPLGAVTVPVTVSSGRGSVSPTSLTFDASSWNTAQDVTFSATDTPRRDGDTTVSVDFGPASGDGAYSGLSGASVSVTVLDNERILRDANASVKGNLGGSLTTADGTCSSVGGGNYAALVVAFGRSPGTPGWVLKPGYNYVRLDDTLIGQANSRGELAFPLDNAPTGAAVLYWTGIRVNSTFPNSWIGGQTCNDWTINFASASYHGDTGDGSATDSTAVDGATINCDQLRSFLCAEQ